ncbi:hypothetical protein NLI96_g4318 [Meripilus lineatus]|uniref:ATP-dependent bile acid permease n=1 Tax=Meripilus lineatus TaxID=2056292 RepID=A0AAD5VAE9_9APHY|nr:hypothetical protein NLI96_g4318 [Physisporinus lineatus]
MSLCNGVGWNDATDKCIREFWAAVIPSALVVLLLILAIPIPSRVQQSLVGVKRTFTNFLTLPEAEALDVGEEPGEEPKQPVPLWRSLLISIISLLEALVWFAYGSFALILDSTSVWDDVRPFLIALSWLYAASRPITRPTATPPFDLFAFFILQLLVGVLALWGILYDYQVRGLALPPPWILAGHVVNLAAVSSLLFLVVSMPLAIPSKRVDRHEIGKSISPEDYTSLWGWISFTWIRPLIKRGTTTTLNESDVWKLSPTFQSRPLYVKFSKLQRSTLLRRLWAANSLDLILDFSLTYVSVIFNYLGPFFLKRILDSLGDDVRNTPEMRSRAYVYAFLAFLSTLCKAQADVQHLWYGRRASTRVRTELMAAIYDKALKRKDFSGIVDKDAKPTTKPSKDPKADDPKAGADVGKIVNLMAGDANRISQTVTGAYFIYGAPFEIIIASIFLYHLLGISAFAGFFVLVIGWPLNNFVAKRAVRIHKGVSTARDKRMGVLNELIGAVKFIKFFAWEERWIKRALDAREVEMQWMIKSRINSACFMLIWTCAPILVSISSFFVYVMRGNELTVGTAFTAIALFGMIRRVPWAPLNVIPAWIVQILQAGVALNRIATYLDEDEVDEQVSSLKKGKLQPSSEESGGLGIVNGSFKWNEVEETKDKDSGKTASNGETLNGTDDAETVVEEQSLLAEDNDHRFELKDITVTFPEGELTVVTGPTASGKTALLMALLGEMTKTSGTLIMSKTPTQIDAHSLTHAISYAAQSPWLRHQSIKENILFGYPYDEERYNAVVECCALNPDLAIFEDGDATEIGARGVSLSGGQKARVALARAVYAPTKYVLLDDPLSAVDSHTARFLYDRLFQGPLLQHRTVILVTHHVELVLPGTYYLIRMLDGRIDTQGTVKDLKSTGVLDDITHDESIEAHKEEQAAAVVEAEASGSGDLPEVAGESTGGTGKTVEKTKKPRKLVEDEHRETGSVKWAIYNTYLKASSYWTWAILTFLIVVNQLLGVSEKFWIRYWGDAYNTTTPSIHTFKSFLTPEHEIPLDPTFGSLHVLHPHYHSNPSFSPFSSFSSSSTFSTTTTQFTRPRAQDHPLFYIGIYAAISLGAGLVNISGAVTQYTGALRASRVLFERLLASVVRATMRWHDVTPQGRMLNRFSKDVETVDLSLAGSLQAVNQALAIFAASVLTVIYVFPLFIFPALIIGFMYRHLAIGYLNTGRDLRRMESNSRSPIFANFGELLEGIVTVRAFSAEGQFLDNLHCKVDLTTQMWYSFWMTNRWLLLHFDALGGLGVLTTTLFALSGWVDAGLAGVCITSAMSFTTSVYWACRFWTALELDLKTPLDHPFLTTPAYWPSSTGPNRDSLISVEDLVIKYSPELPPVLHGVSFDLKARERVGLLGRTGSGKSTLAMSLLRFTDPASGRILVDGIDISTIGLHDLRSRITFIPQVRRDPFLRDSEG